MLSAPICPGVYMRIKKEFEKHKIWYQKKKIENTHLEINAIRNSTPSPYLYYCHLALILRYTKVWTAEYKGLWQFRPQSTIFLLLGSVKSLLVATPPECLTPEWSTPCPLRVASLLLPSLPHLWHPCLPLGWFFEDGWVCNAVLAVHP
jgi:hypothetical protein